MFYSLTGNIINKGVSSVVIECGGVGFLCSTSTFTLYDLSDLDTATVYTHLNVREDALDLYAFSTEFELEWFRMLISVNGVGPKAALAILSEMPPQKLALSISANDVKAITKTPGIGPKIAQRIILDLKDKVKNIASGVDLETGEVIEKLSSVSDMPNASEAVAALTMLGYSQSDASVAVSSIDPTLPVQTIIKQALKLLSSM